MLGNNSTVHQAVKLAIAVLTHTANAPLSLHDFAAVIAEIAAYTSILKRFIKHGFIHCFIPNPWKRIRYFTSKADAKRLVSIDGLHTTTEDQYDLVLRTLEYSR